MAHILKMRCFSIGFWNSDPYKLTSAHASAGQVMTHQNNEEWLIIPQTTSKWRFRKQLLLRQRRSWEAFSVFLSGYVHSFCGVVFILYALFFRLNYENWFLFWVESYNKDFRTSSMISNSAAWTSIEQTTIQNKWSN